MSDLREENLRRLVVVELLAVSRCKLKPNQLTVFVIIIKKKKLLI